LEVAVRTFVKFSLLGLLAVGLTQLPAFAAPAAAPAAPLGVITQADRAMVGSGAAANGATIFDGDYLSTDGSGTLRVRFGASQAYLTGHSAAVVHQAAGGFAAELTSGTIVLSSARGETFQLLASGATIRPGSAEPTVAQVTLVNPNELVLSSRKGTLEVSADGEVRTVPEGTSYRMVMDPAAAQGPAGGPKPAGRSKRKVAFILLTAAGVGAGIGIWRAVESPSEP
jgi:hypothetical protein